MAPNLLLGCLKPLCLGISSGSKRQTLPDSSAVQDLVLSKRSAIAVITGLYSPNPPQDGPRNDNDLAADDDPSAQSNAAVIDPSITPIISSPSCYYEGIGVLIYPSLVLTTHSTIPSPAAAENAEFTLRPPQPEDNCNGVSGSDGEQQKEAAGATATSNQDITKLLQRKFLPHVFFATCPKLNITVIGCEYVNPDLHALGLKPKVGEGLVAGSKAYVLGHDKNSGGPTNKLSIGSASVTSTSNTCIDLISFETHEFWLPGSAGFDENGNFSFLVTETRPTKDLKIGALAIHAIKEWLEPHWHTMKPQVNNSSSSTRRATYSGPQCRPIVISDIITDVGGSRGSNNGKKDGPFRHSSSEVIRRDTHDTKHSNKTPPSKINLKLDTIFDEDKHVSTKQVDVDLVKSETFTKVKSIRDEMHTKEINEKMNMLNIGEDGHRRIPLEGSRGSVKLREQDSRSKKRKSTVNERNPPSVDVSRKLSLHEAFKNERCSLQIKPSDK